MSRVENILKKFTQNPESIRYRDIEKILLYLGCIKIGAKGSHVKFKHSALRHDIIIPVHNNDCKPFYKRQVLKQIINLIRTP